MNKFKSVIAGVVLCLSFQAISAVSYKISDRWNKLPHEIKELAKNKTGIDKVEYRYERGTWLKFRKERIKTHNPRSKTTGTKYWNKSYAAIAEIHEIDTNDVCWKAFLWGNKCQRFIRKDANMSEIYTHSKTLIKDMRAFSLATDLGGRGKARDILYHVLKNRDASKGSIEKRLINTAKNRKYTYKDSVVNLSKSEKEKIGILFLLGILGDKGPNADLVRAASAKANEMGFDSRFVIATPDQSSVVNAEVIRDQVKDMFTNPNIKKVMIVGVSKGVSDYVEYFYSHAEKDLTKSQRKKLYMFMSLAGVNDHSIIAKWLSKAKTLSGRIWRTLVKMKGLFPGVSSLKDSFWRKNDMGKVKRLFPNLKWVSVVALPEGSEGHSLIARSNATIFDAQTRNLWPETGPTDGLVEAAAQILPSGTGIKEYIVPIMAPHGFSKGVFSDGSILAYSSLDKKGLMDTKPQVPAGPEIIDVFFRALPQYLIK